MFKHIPNILTMSRFILIPFIVYFINVENYLLAFIFLTISALTDILDGFIARKFNLITNFGKLIDPLADKATQVSILIILKKCYTFVDFSSCFCERTTYGFWSIIFVW